MRPLPVGHILASVAIAGSVFATSGAAETALTKSEQAALARLEQEVNRRFWLMFPEQKAVVLCPSATERFDLCKVVSQGSFVVESISLQRGFPSEKPVVYLAKFYFVRFDDGASGYIPAALRSYFLTEDPKVLAASREAEKKSCEERGDVKLGMTKEEVVATCWGEPARVVQPRMVPSTREYLIYGAGRFLTFESGRLVAIR